MSTIQIGRIIAAHRKEKGITQEELANHLGVSKPAVSKWESGQSYPDILLLPELAAYFDITIDQLIGYEPQMSKEDVRKLYHRLANDFTGKPFSQVYEECEGYIKKYFSCWELQYRMGLLLINHASLAGSQEKAAEIIERVLKLYQRVEQSCNEVIMAKLALKMQAICHIMLQRPSEAIDILENIKELPLPVESMLVKAYQMKGDQQKALEYLQGSTYLNLVTMLGSATDYLAMYAGQPERMGHYYDLFTGLGKLFEVEELHPVMLIQIHLSAAMNYIAQGNKEEALNALEKYTELLLKSNHGDFSLHGNRIFDVLDRYLASEVEETDLPRSSKAVWADLVNLLLHNPIFESLEKEERFIRMKKQVEHYAR
ncbi:MAG TPA: helix-turn-helix domain-containing protein [Clostridiales bacterium]|nr:helix-turn-helix domain-containing protein [Clostridiales bacterium]